ncbi:MAG: hypothetical protein MMC33_008006 [Icmadophila ericetorum]|nr:hypothetical protein [Icmadophila ericetorum]
MYFFRKALCISSLAVAAYASAVPRELIPRTPLLQLVNLRIEGSTETFYEAPIISGPHNVTTASGGTHPCNGLNLNANPTPGNTPTDALDAASKLAGFTFDGTFDTEFDDFFITRIATDTETATEFWGLLVNFQFTPVGGCQFETNTGDEVLWAFNAFNLEHFLKVTPGDGVVKRGGSITVTVTDGSTGEVIEGAVIDGVTTNASGEATLTFPHVGIFSYKATLPGSLRSNALRVVVA